MTGTDLRGVNPGHRTAALLTPAGRGAVATIRIVEVRKNPPLENIEEDMIGLNSYFKATNGLSIADQPVSRIIFGKWGQTNIEELVVCRPAPGVLEIHCHGGDAAARRILDDLESAGYQTVNWRDQVVQATDLLDAECLEVLSLTTTWKATGIVIEQSSGLLRTAFETLRRTEPEDESTIQSALDGLLKWAAIGLHLSTPWSVVLTGRPNVGKSSLINALLGYERAIVFDQPGTTRDIVTGETAFDGWPVSLADTAGIRDNAGQLEAAGIAMARRKLETADLRLVLIDVSQPPVDDDDRLLAQWPDSLIVAHKSDLPDQWGNRLPERALKVSSVTGEGMIELQRRLVQQLVPESPPPGTAIPMTMRQIGLLQAARIATSSDGRRHAIERLFGGFCGSLLPERQQHIA